MNALGLVRPSAWQFRAAYDWMPAAGLLLAAFWPVTLLLVEPGDVVISVLVGTLFFLVGYLVLVRLAKGDYTATRVIRPAIGLKMAGAAAYILVISAVYHGGADVMGTYWSDALISAETFRVTGQLNVSTRLGTDFVQLTSGLLYAIIGPSLTSAILLFSFVALLGQFLYYRTFRIAYPDADPTLAAVLMFAYPSLLFWASTVGKDSLMLFALGLTAYGFARALQHSDWRGWVCVAISLVVQYFVRPHIAAASGIALLTAFIIARNRRGLNGIILRLVALPLVIAACFYLFQRAESLLKADSIGSGLESLANTQVGTRVGGSSYNEGIGTRLALSPFLLQRPFPWEARSLQSALASLEGILTAVLIWSRRGHILAAVRRMRQEPFLSFVVVFASMLMVLLSLPFSNFGLLARERTMVLPFVLLLVSAPLPADQKTSRVNVGAMPPAAAFWSGRALGVAAARRPMVRNAGTVTHSSQG